MIKIKTKIINKDTNKETIGVSYKVKDTNNYEHLVLINHLLHQILDTNMYTKNELMKIVKMYLENDTKESKNKNRYLGKNTNFAKNKR